MIHRLFSLLVLMLFCTPLAQAQTGVQTPPRPLDDYYLVENPVQPSFVSTFNPPASLPPKAADDFGEVFLTNKDDLVWSVDPTIGQLAEPTFLSLSDTQKDAVDLAPTWLQTPLAHRFLDLNADVAEELAALIITPPDDRYRDELAFLVAYMGTKNLEGCRDRVALLTANVQTIYENDADLDYVEIVEIEDDGKGDYGTTLRYNVLNDGVPGTYELPMEIYYWYVVHSKLDVESPDYIYPLTGNDEDPADGGISYREYLLYDIAGEGSYHTPMYFAGVEEADLQNLNPSARGYLTDLSIHNIEAVYHGVGPEAAMVEFAYGSGEIFATTLRLETAATENGCPLLENLLNQGCGDVSLNTGAPIALLGDTLVPEFQTALTNLGRWADTTQITTAELTAFTEDNWTALQGAYDKIVILPNQTRDFYETIANNKAHFETYVNAYNVLQIHLATDDADDPAGLVFPGGFTCAPQAANETNEVTLYGRPILIDMLAGQEYLWDGEEVNLGGDRPLWDNTCAVAAIGNWVGKNMLDNIAERYDLGADVERSIQPVRIAYNHYGNCGELQDLSAAAMRTALIPAALVSTMNEDHVFNEFYCNDEWRPFQVEWSNNLTQIDNHGIAYDANYGGSKNISFVISWLGDGSLATVPDHFSDYITANFTITDADDKPVPDCLIELLGPAIYGGVNEGLSLITDTNGQATVTLGENVSYFMRLESSAGDYPPTKDGKTGYLQIIDSEDATAGAVFEVEYQFEDTMVNMTPMDIEQKNDTFAFHVTIGATHRWAGMTNIFSSIRAYYPRDEKLLDVYLLNDANLKKAQAENAFEAAAAYLGVAELDELIYPPQEGNWNLFIKALMADQSDHSFDITVTTEGDLYVPETDDDDNNDTTDDDDNDTTGDDDTGGSTPTSDDDDDDDDDSCGC